MKKILFLISILIPDLFGIASVKNMDPSLKISTLYGEITTTDAVIKELIESSAFKRLKNIRQYGVTYYANQEYEYTRYQHSLGVYFITKKFGAPLEEQVAGLLHDVSHTVFSHVGDIFFDNNYRTGKNSYQDNIHEWYLEKSGITEILKKYGLEKSCCLEKKKTQLCFDQNLPNLCADRIEYNLAGGFIDNLISKEDILNIINNLYFENRNWFFKDKTIAKQFGLLSIKLSELRWGATWDNFVSFQASQAMKQACKIKLIDHNDIHFSTDDIIWNRLNTSEDPEIKKSVGKVKNHKNSYIICDQENSDLHLIGKFSGTDPLVQINNTLLSLSQIDENYKQEFDKVKQTITQGTFIKYLD